MSSPMNRALIVILALITSFLMGSSVSSLYFINLVAPVMLYFPLTLFFWTMLYGLWYGVEKAKRNGRTTKSFNMELLVSSAIIILVAHMLNHLFLFILSVVAGRG